MNTNPTPDAVLASLIDTDFDLPQAAKALLLPLTLLLRLLKTPEFAGPLNDLHELSRQCLDIRAARTLARSLDLLDAAFDKSEDPAEHRRIATAVTKAANATARLTRDTRAARATDRRSGRSLPSTRDSGGSAAGHALMQPHIGDDAGQPAAEHVHPDLAAAYEAVREAWTALRAHSNPSTQEEFARRYNEWKALETHYSPGPAHLAA